MSTPITTMSNAFINITPPYHGPGKISGDSNRFSIGRAAGDQIQGDYPSAKSHPSHDATSSNNGQKIKPGENRDLKKDGLDYNKNNEIKLEIRDSSIEDGQLCIRVYSNKGKLLRQIPPGYIPFGEYAVNVKI